MGKPTTELGALLLLRIAEAVGAGGMAVEEQLVKAHELSSELQKLPEPLGLYREEALSVSSETALPNESAFEPSESAGVARPPLVGTASPVSGRELQSAMGLAVHSKA